MRGHLSAVSFLLLLLLQQLISKPSPFLKEFKKRKDSPSSSKTPSLLRKLEQLENYQKTTVKQYRGSVYSQNTLNPHDLTFSSNEIHSIEEEEAIIMQTTLTHLLDALDITMKNVPRMIRICTDTIANTFSGLMMGIGGILNLFANTFSILSYKLNDAQTRYSLNIPTEEYWKLQRYYKQYYQNQSQSIIITTTYPNQTTAMNEDDVPSTSSSSSPLPPTPLVPPQLPSSSMPPRKLPNYLLYRINKSLMKINTIQNLQTTANLFFGLREVCIITAEVSEAVTLGLGEALENSFQGLQFLPKITRYLTDSLLMLDDPSDQSYYDYLQLKRQQALNKTLQEEEMKKQRREDKEHRIDSLPQFIIPAASAESLNSDSFNASNDSDIYDEEKQHTLSSKRILIRPNKRFNRSSAMNETSEESNHRQRGVGGEDSSIYRLFLQFQEFEINLYYQFFDFLLHCFDFINHYFALLLNEVYQSLSIIKHSLEIPSISLHLLLSFFVILFISALPLSRSIRLPLLMMTMIGLWAMIILMEYTQRYRLIQRIQVETLGSFLQEEMTQYSPFTALRNSNNSQSQSVDRTAIIEDLKRAYTPLTPSSHTPPSTEANTAQTPSPHNQPHHNHHHMMWLNTLIASLWNIIDSDFYNSGLGLYMSEVYEEFFSSLLNSIHETTSGFINDMKLKKFHFGINPPIIQHIETSIIRDHQCIEKLLHQSMEQHAQQKRRRRGRRMGGGLGEGMSERQQKGRSRHKDIIQRYLKALHLNTSSLLTEEQEEFLVNLSEQVSDFILDNLLKAHASFQDDGSFDPSTDSLSSEENRTDSNTSSTTSSFSRRNKDSAMKLNHFFMACDTLIMDVDVIYVSKDMNIILSLRTNEIKSMLPEFTIHLSELIFQGKIRFKLELANDYPFIGHNTTVSISASVFPPFLSDDMSHVLYRCHLFNCPY